MATALGQSVVKLALWIPIVLVYGIKDEFVRPAWRVR